MHHLYSCKCYPDFSFVVPPLRKTITDTRFPSAVIHFHHGFLSTANLRLNGEEPWITEAQAEIIHKWLLQRRERPVFGSDILEIDPSDKSKPCPYCFVRVKTAKELAKHIEQCTAGGAAPVPEKPETVRLGVKGA